MVRNRFGLWVGLAVATLVGMGVAAYLALKHERTHSELNQVQELIERSQDIVRQLEEELGSQTPLEAG